MTGVTVPDGLEGLGGQTSLRLRFVAVLVSALCSAVLGALPAFSQSSPPARPKIGLITSLSGQSAYIGTDIRDGFLLAMARESRLLGREIAEIVIRDDSMLPDKGLAQFRDLQQAENIRLFAGFVSTDIAALAVPEIVKSGALYVSPNAAPNALSGKACHPNYFVMSFQNDSMVEIAAGFASQKGFARAYILSASYQAGQEAAAGFRQHFKGTVVGQSLVSFGQTDFSSELQKIHEAKPDVVLQFLPGSLGVTFLRSFQDARMSDKIAMVLPASALDHRMTAIAGASAAGVFVTSHWNADFAHEANRSFVSEWQARYNRPPTLYAMQGYDTGLALAAAVTGAGGMTDDPKTIAAELRKAEFRSPRGTFRFGRNQHPVQDWWLLSVRKNAQGQYQLTTESKLRSGHSDSYADQCALPALPGVPSPT